MHILMTNYHVSHDDADYLTDEYEEEIFAMNDVNYSLEEIAEEINKKEAM